MTIRGATKYLGAAILMLCASSAWADYSFVCGSEGGHRRTCALREPGNIRLVRQISGAKCEQGRSWDFDRRELWVDHGCEAEFVVEVRRDYDRRGDDRRGDERPRDDGPPRDYGRPQDPNGYVVRRAPDVPGWMIGTFRGYDAQYRADVTISVRPDGRVRSVLGGREFDGYVAEEQLHIGDFTFDLDRTRDGFTTSQKGAREHVVQYQRVN